MLAENSSRNYISGQFNENQKNDYTSSSRFFFDDSKLISLITNRTHNESISFEDALKALEDWRHKFNISVSKECDQCQYCSGEFRDLVLAYNSIHGYVSLLVSF